MIVYIQFDYDTLVEDINGDEESDIFSIVGKELFMKIKSLLTRKVAIKSPILPSFRGYNDRPIACNGDCGSKFAKMINNCIYQRVQSYEPSIHLMLCKLCNNNNIQTGNHDIK